MKSPAPPPTRPNAGVDAAASVSRASMAATARKRYGVMAEVSHVAALTAERLEQAAVPQGIGKVEIATGELDAIKAMLREIQTTSHLAFLQRQGEEADYQVIGARMTKRHRTPSGKWR